MHHPRLEAHGAGLPEWPQRLVEEISKLGPAIRLVRAAQVLSR